MKGTPKLNNKRSVLIQLVGPERYLKCFAQGSARGQKERLGFLFK
jgi:hypothetical protein